MIQFSLNLKPILSRLMGLGFLLSALVLAGCVSSGSSTSGYTGPSIVSVSAKKTTASKSVREAKKKLRSTRNTLKNTERQTARDERRLKRKRLSAKARKKIEARVKKRKPALRTAKRDLTKAKKAYDRAVRSEKRAIRAVAITKHRKAEAERRFAAAKKRKEERLALAEKRREQKLARLEASSGETIRTFGIGLFGRPDPALKNIKDYGARVDGGFSLAAIPVKKIDKSLLRQRVRYSTSHKPGTLVVDPSSKFLYLVQSGGRAMRYGIGVGKSGFEWSGSARIGWKREWPKWTPPNEMIARSPSLRRWSAKNGGMPGGPKNPLGARALYLMQGGVDTLYRLHGTPQWKSIGTAASSGCIRLMNQDIIDLYERVPNGAKVVVL